MTPKIAYDGPVSNFMRKQFSDSKMNRSGKNLIAEMMQEIHLYLIKNFENEYESLKKISDDSVLKCIQKAVGKTLPSDMKQPALAEANRQLFLFQNGQLEYDHIASIQAVKESPEYRKTPKKKKTGTVHDAFNSAVTKIVSHNYPDLKLENNAKHFLGFHLYDMANQVAQIVSKSATETSHLEYADIKDVLPEFLTSDVLKLAYDEGGRALFHHAAGFDIFKPRKPIISEQPVDLKESANLKLLASSTIFNDAIKKCLSSATHVKSPIKFDQGCKRIAKHLSSIVDFLSTVVATHSYRMNVKEIDLKHVREIMYKIFPQDLLLHAEHSGFICVENYVKGILKYRKRAPRIPKSDSTPKTKRRKTSSKRKRKSAKVEKTDEPSKSRKKEKSVDKSKLKSKSPNLKQAARYLGMPSTSSPVKKTAKGKKVNLKQAAKYLEMPTTSIAVKKTAKVKKLNFSKPILNLFEKPYFGSSASIGSEGINAINSCMLDVYNLLITQCSSQQSSVTAETVRAAVENVFPRALCEPAIADALRKVPVAYEIPVQSLDQELDDEVQMDTNQEPEQESAYSVSEPKLGPDKEEKDIEEDEEEENEEAGESVSDKTSEDESGNVEE